MSFEQYYNKTEMSCQIAIFWYFTKKMLKFKKFY